MRVDDSPYLRNWCDWDASRVNVLDQVQRWRSIFCCRTTNLHPLFRLLFCFRRGVVKLLSWIVGNRRKKFVGFFLKRPKHCWEIRFLVCLCSAFDKCRTHLALKCLILLMKNRATPLLWVACRLIQINFVCRLDIFIGYFRFCSSFARILFKRWMVFKRNRTFLNAKTKLFINVWVKNRPNQTRRILSRPDIQIYLC